MGGVGTAGDKGRGCPQRLRQRAKIIAITSSFLLRHVAAALIPGKDVCPIYVDGTFDI